MTYTPHVTGRIVLIDTEHGIRYALVINGRVCSPELPTMSEAAMFAYKYGVEVVK